MLSGMIALTCKIMAQAIIVGCVIGLMQRLGNIFIRAFSGKEDIL